MGQNNRGSIILNPPNIPDAEAFQLVFNQFLMLEGFENIEYDQDQTAGPCHWKQKERMIFKV